MSQNEKSERLHYRKWRRKHITIQLAAVVLFACITLILLLQYCRASRDLYLYYTENGDADYRVYLAENEFYTEEYLGEENVYVAELIDHIAADFSYDLAIDAAYLQYDYTYRIDAQLEIRDKTTGEALYEPVYILKAPVSLASSEKTLAIREQVDIDYQKYHTIAKDYMEAYELRNVTAALIVRAHIGVDGICALFAEDYHSEYLVELHIPLASSVVDLEVHTTVPQTENKILVSNPAETETLRMFMLVFAFLTAALLISLLFFIRITRNKHIEYTGKVERLVANYKSYIQKINNVFDPTGYQILSVASFNELLEIRDTLQAPILMLENKDKTSTKFIVPTSTKILYLYEIRVEG